MAVAHKPVIAEEPYRVPYDGVRGELVPGEVDEPAPAGYAQARNVSATLAWCVREQGLDIVAETGFENSDAPDAAFVRRESVEGAGEAEALAEKGTCSTRAGWCPAS